MKKLMLTLCLCAGVCLPGFCLTYDFYLYEIGDFKYTIDENVRREKDMTINEVLAVINRGGFLPLEVGHAMAFQEVGDKRKAVEAVEAKLEKEKNYRTYYNAAVIYANKAGFEGYDSVTIPRKEHAEKAIHYAAKAIEIGKKNGYDKSPYMNLLIGEMYFGRARQDKAKAEAALKNFQKVETLNAFIAPYNEMAMLAGILGNKKLEEQYTKLSEKYSKIREEKVNKAKREREAAAKAVKREVHSKGVKFKKSGSDLSKAWVSPHWRF